MLRWKSTWPGIVLLAASCARGEARVRNVLLVTLDTTRADVLAGDEPSRRLAPALAALAEHGLRFPRAYTVAPLTLPAHASILTGLYPPRHGVRDNGLVALPDAATTLAEVCRAAGLETAAFVSSAVLDRGFNLDQGFELYDQPALGLRTAQDMYLERPALSTAEAVQGWLERRDPARPFFLWVHLFDPHVPSEPAPEFLDRAGGDPYRGEVAAVDAAVGAIVEELEETGLEDSTLVVVTADHGESLGEHGEPTHGALCYEQAVQVPLLFRFPAEQPAPGPARIASAVDLAPTILGRLELEPPAGLDGVDLFSPEAPAERGVYFESLSGFLNFGWSPLCGWLDSLGKYLHSSEPEFYLPLEDPAEQRNLARERVKECQRAREKLRGLLARPSLASAPAAADGELLRTLDQLGYAHAGDELPALPSPLEESDRPSPGSRTEELAPLLLAHALFQAGRSEECQPLLEGILRENPGHLFALDLLSLCRMRAQDWGRAEEFLRRRIALGSPRADTHLNLGLCLLELGRRDEAQAALLEAERLEPERGEIRAALERCSPGR
jgi:arylsulfatase A-like enzyme